MAAEWALVSTREASCYIYTQLALLDIRGEAIGDRAFQEGQASYLPPKPKQRARLWSLSFGKQSRAMPLVSAPTTSPPSSISHCCTSELDLKRVLSVLSCRWRTDLLERQTSNTNSEEIDLREYDGPQCEASSWTCCKVEDGAETIAPAARSRCRRGSCPLVLLCESDAWKRRANRVRWPDPTYERSCSCRCRCGR